MSLEAFTVKGFENLSINRQLQYVRVLRFPDECYQMFHTENCKMACGEHWSGDSTDKGSWLSRSVQNWVVSVTKSLIRRMPRLSALQ